VQHADASAHYFCLALIIIIIIMIIIVIIIYKQNLFTRKDLNAAFLTQDGLDVVYYPQTENINTEKKHTEALLGTGKKVGLLSGQGRTRWCLVTRMHNKFVT
jgi:hypothetical protein